MAAPYPSSFSLDEQLCFALYTASRAMTGCYRPLLDGLSLTYPQYLVMLVLWERGEATVGGLGESLHLETGTLSPLLKRLEGAGLIWRRRRPDDERSVLIGLTDAGHEMRRRADAVPSTVAAATGMSTDEIDRLREMLQHLADTLRSSDLAGTA